MTITIPAPPTLARVNRVELLHAGTWNALYGEATFTPEDLAAAVGALDCPAVRRPALKFGHDGVHGVGLPALGWVENMALSDDGRTIIGDYAGMPAWLAGVNDDGQTVLASAYPDRSIEGTFDFKCQLTHTHPFVIHAVALLGVERPAVGTLPSLQDLAVTYGVALADEADASGSRVTVQLSATDGRNPMPNPRPAQVAASVSVEDVRREYYDKAPWSHWITEVHLEPLQLIVVDDDTGQRFRIPVDVTGEDTFTFGDPVPVLVRYVDKPDAAVAAGGVQPVPIVYASRTESRPGARPALAEADVTPEPPQAGPPAAEDAVAPGAGLGPAVEVVRETPAADAAPELPAAEPEQPTENEEDPVSDLSAVRARLGLDETADEAAILAALDSRLPTQPDPDPKPDDEPVVEVEPEKELVSAATTPTLPEGVVTIDKDTLTELRRNAQLGAAAHERQRVSDRDATIAAAMSEGKFAPARKDHWVKSWEADPEGTKATLATLEPGLIPVVATAAGTAGPGESEADELGIGDDALSGWAAQLGVDAKELSRG